MPTKYDEKFMYLRFEYGLSRPQMNDLINRVIEENEEALANSKDRDNLLYDLVVGELSRSTEASSVSNSTETVKEQLEPQVIDNNIDIESGEYEDKEESWCEIVSHEALRKSKYFNAYAITVATGNFNQEKQDFRSYIYKEALDDRITKFLEEAKTEFPDGKIPAVKTVKNHIAELVKCKIPLEMIKIEPTANGVVYKLRNRVDNHWYVQLPYRQIRELVVATNRNMLKLFVVLKYTCNKDCKTFTTIDRGYLAREMGLSDKSTRGKDDISTMLIALAKLGYIEIRQETRTDYDEKAGREIGKKVNSYRLRSLEEYDNINLIAKGRKPKK